jgi:hypothetical protein
MCALNGGSAVNRIILVLAVLVLQMPANGQDNTKPIKWYKFNKAFIQQHYAQDGSALVR